MIAPDTEAGIAEAVRAAAGPLLVQGNGTKSGMLRPVQASEVLSTTALAGVSFYAPKELVISAKAGTRLTEIEALLAANNQHLVPEPSHFFGDAQTIGGIVATNLSGPRRVMGGALRDHVLGLRAVTGKGEVQNYGGRVLKNVTGLDFCKLLTGSHGTLAVITEVTLKVLPAPFACGTLLLRAPDARSGVALLSAGLGSPFSVSGAAWLPAEKIAALRIEDFESSVRYRCGRLAAALGGGEILNTDDSKDFWRRLRDAEILREMPAVWRVSVPPSAGPDVLRAAEAAGASGFLDWGGGLAWLGGAPETKLHEAICAAALAARGVWWLMRAPPPLRATVQVVPPEPPALAKISGQIRQRFDPRGILNPGRLRAA